MNRYNSSVNQLPGESAIGKWGLLLLGDNEFSSQADYCSYFPPAVKALNILLKYHSLWDKEDEGHIGLCKVDTRLNGAFLWWHFFLVWVCLKCASIWLACVNAARVSLSMLSPYCMEGVCWLEATTCGVYTRWWMGWCKMGVNWEATKFVVTYHNLSSVSLGTSMTCGLG